MEKIRIIHPHHRLGLPRTVLCWKMETISEIICTNFGPVNCLSLIFQTQGDLHFSYRVFHMEPFQYLHDDCYYMKIQLIASVCPIDHQNPYTHPKHILQNMNSPSRLTISLRTKGYTEVQLNLTFFWVSFVKGAAILEKYFKNLL